jgi:hypothetical protein
MSRLGCLVCTIPLAIAACSSEARRDHEPTATGGKADGEAGTAIVLSHYGDEDLIMSLALAPPADEKGEPAWQLTATRGERSKVIPCVPARMYLMEWRHTWEQWVDCGETNENGDDYLIRIGLAHDDDPDYPRFVAFVGPAFPDVVELVTGSATETRASWSDHIFNILEWPAADHDPFWPTNLVIDAMYPLLGREYTLPEANNHTLPIDFGSTTTTTGFDTRAVLGFDTACCEELPNYLYRRGEISLQADPADPESGYASAETVRQRIEDSLLPVTGD